MGGYVAYRCSKCLFVLGGDTVGMKPWKFCPNCGTKIKLPERKHA